MRRGGLGCFMGRYCVGSRGYLDKAVVVYNLVIY